MDGSSTGTVTLIVMQDMRGGESSKVKHKEEKTMRKTGAKSSKRRTKVSKAVSVTTKVDAGCETQVTYKVVKQPPVNSHVIYA